MALEDDLLLCRYVFSTVKCFDAAKRKLQAAARREALVVAALLNKVRDEPVRIEMGRDIRMAVGNEFSNM